MAQFAPQYNLFTIVSGINRAAVITFWSVFILSIGSILFNDFLTEYNIRYIIDIINIVSTGLFFVFEMITEYILIPMADNTRRDDFIDNALGSKFATNNSIGYYDNEEVGTGLYKVVVNLFENCYFTFTLVKITWKSKILIPAIGLFIISVIAYFGFKEVPIALTILQTFFSANILGGLVKHLILFNRLSNIHSSLVTLFQNTDLKSNTRKYEALVYRFWLQYETLHSKIPAGIPDSVFNKHNTRLTTEWDALKFKYNIN